MPFILYLFTPLDYIKYLSVVLIIQITPTHEFERLCRRSAKEFNVYLVNFQVKLIGTPCTTSSQFGACTRVKQVSQVLCVVQRRSLRSRFCINTLLARLVGPRSLDIKADTS